jgi:hypothetical protein
MDVGAVAGLVACKTPEGMICAAMRVADTAGRLINEGLLRHGLRQRATAPASRVLPPTGQHQGL